MDIWRQNEKIYGQYLKSSLENMALYGGYPGVLQQKGESDRVGELGEIYQSYLKKDIIDLLKIDKSEVFNHLVKVLASKSEIWLTYIICPSIGFCCLESVSFLMDKEP